MNRMNKLIPLVLFVVVAALITVGIAVFSGSESTPPQTTANLPRQQQPANPRENKIKQKYEDAERDSYIETLRTVAKNQETLLNRVNDLEKNMEGRLTKKIDTAIGKETESTFKQIQQEVDSLVKPIQEVAEKLKPTSHTKSTGKDGSKGYDIPSGLGFDSLPLDGAPSGGDSAVATMPSSDRYMTIVPTQSGFLDEEGEPLGMLGIDRYLGKNASADDDPAVAVRTPKSKPEPIPAYTIPATSTLFSNTTMTAMLGVVPQKGAVKDPVKFKVITGNENMSSNGFYMPDVQNIIWSGEVIGNREMSCVRGTLRKVTFIFRDGTVSTIDSKGSGGSGSSGGSVAGGLGYISDRWGKPCIPGELITNADKYLLSRLVATTAEAAAEGAAATEITTLRDTQTGELVNFVSGDTTNYIASKALSGSMSEIADYIRDRQDDALEFVYVDAGHEIVLHVEEEIAIDYDPAGRKLNHHFEQGRITIGQAFD